MSDRSEFCMPLYVCPRSDIRRVRESQRGEVGYLRGGGRAGVADVPDVGGRAHAQQRAVAVAGGERFVERQ